VADARLAHTGLSDEQQQMRTATGRGRVDGMCHEAQFGVAPDERCPPPIRTRSWRQQRLLGDAHLDRFLPTLDDQRTDRRVSHRLTRGGDRGRPDEHLTRLRRGLESTRAVDHVAHGRVVAAGAQCADEHLAGVDTDAQLQGSLVVGGGPVRQCSLHSQARAYRALSVVFVRDRRAEESEDGVTDDLVDATSEGGDVEHETLEASVDEVLHTLWISGLGDRREADDIREEDGDHAALIRATLQRLSAGRTETCSVDGEGPTRRAGHGEILRWRVLVAPQ
jgi:hypothetical protein